MRFYHMTLDEVENMAISDLFLLVKSMRRMQAEEDGRFIQLTHFDKLPKQTKRDIEKEISRAFAREIDVSELGAVLHGE